jgi:hypothetical protein
MATHKFYLVRAAVIDEYYEVEADSEAEALEIAYDGDLADPYKTEFRDWADEEYEVVESEVIDPLYVMVKDYKSVDKLDT